jgi:acetyltransferase-like isoleucine patch superfamily enzyme
MFDIRFLGEVTPTSSSHLLTVGNFTSVGFNVVVQLGGNHALNWGTTFPLSFFWDDPEVAPSAESLHHGDGAGNAYPECYPDRCPLTRGAVTIGSDVWIGSDVTILSGVTIGDGAIIGANAVVAKDVPPYAIVVGNSARVVKYRFERSVVAEFLRVKWWQWDESKIKKCARLLQSVEVYGFFACADGKEIAEREL